MYFIIDSSIEIVVNNVIEKEYRFNRIRRLLINFIFFNKDMNFYSESESNERDNACLQIAWKVDFICVCFYMRE